MSLTKNLIKYFQRLETDFRSNYRAIRVEVDYPIKRVHDLRVALKKEFAFLRFLQRVDRSFPFEKCWQILKGIHRTSGKLRNLEVESKLIAETEDEIQMDHKFSEYFAKDADLLKLQLQNYERYHPFVIYRAVAQKVIVHVNSLDEECLVNDIKEYFLDVLEGIKDIADDVEPDFHEIRVLIKELYYNLRMLSRITFLPSDKALLKKLDDWQDELGLLHDYDITIKELNHRRTFPRALKNRLKENRLAEKSKVEELVTNVDGLVGQVMVNVAFLLAAYAGKYE